MEDGVIFSDESGHDSDNTYGAICTVSGHRKNLIELHKTLEKIIVSFNKNEIKFKEVKGGLKLNIAKQFVVEGLNQIQSKNIKVHILVWDKHDKRHTVQNRCDIENLKRMYYHILRQVKIDWKYINNWAFYPDELTSINWKDDIVKYIENTKLYNESDLFKSVFNFRFPNYQKAIEKNSEVMLNIQLADLFAGIVRNSREKKKEYGAFIKSKQNQISLFDEELYSISSNLKPKLELMQYFKDECSKRKLGVSFSKSNYFETYNKKENIFIWHYSPISDFDKAPTKIKI